METAVYTATKPGSAFRTLCCALAYLLVVLVLASTLVTDRRRELVGQRIPLDSWMLSFRVPKGFQAEGIMHHVGGDIVPFVQTTRDGSTAILAIRRFTVSEVEDLPSVCLDLVLGHYTTADRPRAEELPRPIPARLGPYDGVEIIDPKRSIQVRVARQDAKKCVAVELVVQGKLIDDALCNLFEQFSRSIQNESQ